MRKMPHFDPRAFGPLEAKSENPIKSDQSSVIERAIIKINLRRV